MKNLLLTFKHHQLIKQSLAYACLSLISFTASADVFVGAGNPQPIPLVGAGGFPCVGGPTTSVAAVSLSGTVGSDISINDVTLDITHTFDSDLEIDLISPAGTVWDLSSDNGGAGNNFMNTVFQDGAPSITTGSAPFTGTFEAEEGPFTTAFAGEEVNGNWILSICDDAAGDSGTLNSWSINIIPDTTPPNVTAPSDITMESTGVLTPVALGVATATDDVDQNPTITNDNPGPFPLGDTIVTWTATDAAGNTDTATQTVTIEVCTDLSKLICIYQNSEIQPFCDSISLNPSHHVITSPFGNTYDIPPTADIYNLINNYCGP